MIFVFGSNLAGIHGAGAAKYAYEYLGAEWGVGRGMCGDFCYALPTKNEKIQTMPWPWVRENIKEFVEFAKENWDKEFALTPVGTGLARHSKRDVWEALQEFGLPDNVYLTSSWVTG